MLPEENLSYFILGKYWRNKNKIFEDKQIFRRERVKEQVTAKKLTQPGIMDPDKRK